MKQILRNKDKGTALEMVTKKLEEYIDSASEEESKITII